MSSFPIGETPKGWQRGSKIRIAIQPSGTGQYWALAEDMNSAEGFRRMMSMPTSSDDIAYITFDCQQQMADWIHWWTFGKQRTSTGPSKAIIGFSDFELDGST
jgi:hypothetical protein